MEEDKEANEVATTTGALQEAQEGDDGIIKDEPPAYNESQQLGNENREDNPIHIKLPVSPTPSAALAVNEMFYPAQNIRQDTPPPPDYMVMSVAVCFMCCNWGVSLCAIMLSGASRDAAARGDYETARKTGRQAFFLNIFSIVLSSVILMILIILAIAGVLKVEG